MADFQSIGGALALLCGIAAIARRKYAIGGWLFYFYCQVFLGLALIAASTSWQSYLPRTWNDPARYFAYAISNLSRVVLMAAIGAVCIRLAGTRERRDVCALRLALAAYAFLTVLKLVADFYCFPAAARRDAMSLAFPVVWMVYFGASQRVRQVFAR
jgi:hypothetical protein